MSFQDILSPPVKNWCDLYVNSITAATGMVTTSSYTDVISWSVKGAFTGAGITGTISFYRVGNQVTMTLGSFFAQTTAAQQMIGVLVIPLEYVPASGKFFSIPAGTNDATWTGKPAVLRVSLSSGTTEVWIGPVNAISGSPGSYSSPGVVVAFKQCSFTYTV